MPDGTDIEENYFCGCYNGDDSTFIPTADERKKWEKGEIGLFIPYYFNNVIMPYLAILKQNLTYLAFDFDYKSQSFLTLSASRVNGTTINNSYCLNKYNGRKWVVVDGALRYVDGEIAKELKLIYRRLVRRVFLEATSQYDFKNLRSHKQLNEIEEELNASQ